MYDFKAELEKRVAKQRAKYRLTDMRTTEVSLVNRAANGRVFVTIKSAKALVLRPISPPPKPPAPVAKVRDQHGEADLDASERAVAKQRAERGAEREAVLRRAIAGDDASARALARVELGELSPDGDVLRRSAT